MNSCSLSMLWSQRQVYLYRQQSVSSYEFILIAEMWCILSVSQSVKKNKKTKKTVKLLMRLEFHAKLDIACFCFWHYHKWMVEWTINVLHVKPNNSNNKTHVTRNTQKGEFLLSSCHQPCARTWAVILSVAHSLFCRCLWSEEVRHMPWEFPAMFFSWFDSWPVLFHGLT